jgi:hypothetical protein
MTEDQVAPRALSSGAMSLVKAKVASASIRQKLSDWQIALTRINMAREGTAQLSAPGAGRQANARKLAIEVRDALADFEREVELLPDTTASAFPITDVKRAAIGLLARLDDLAKG